MVIGNGLVARSFQHYKGSAHILIFASGVSNSKTSTAADFKREQDLLTDTLQAHPDKTIVYFSTTSIDDPDLQATSYVKHKLHMETIIAAKAISWHIFRVPNLAGASSNPNTVLNFFFYHIMRQQPFELWKNSERNIIDVEDVIKTVDFIAENKFFSNKVVNIANTGNYPVPFIVKCMETFCHRKGAYTEKEKGSSFTIDLADIKPVFNQLNIRFTNDYLPALLEKYYSAHDV